MYILVAYIQAAYVPNRKRYPKESEVHSIQKVKIPTLIPVKVWTPVWTVPALPLLLQVLKRL